MSKKQLEEMNQLLSDYYEGIDDPFSSTDNAIAIIDRVGSLINYAKDQVELVEHLKGTVAIRDRAVQRIVKQNKRYREALEDILNNDEMRITNQEIIEKALEESE